MLRLVIDWGPARLGLEHRPAKFEIDYALQAMRLKTDPAVLDIEIEYPRVELDLEEPMAEIGLKNFLRLARELAAKGRQAAYEGIGRYAREGDELAAIHEDADVAQVAAERAWPMDGRQLNVDVAPKSRVGVDAYGGIEIDYRPGRLSAAVPWKPVSVSFRPGAVRSYLAAKAFIEIGVVGDRYSAVG